MSLLRRLIVAAQLLRPSDLEALWDIGKKREKKKQTQTEEGEGGFLPSPPHSPPCPLRRAPLPYLPDQSVTPYFLVLQFDIDNVS